MKTVLFLLVVIVLIATGETLRCYSCFPWNSKCHEFDKNDKGVEQKNCSSVANRCVKGVAQFSNGTSATIRSCDVAEPIGRSVYIDSQALYYCDSDLCNGVSSTGVSLTTLIVLTAPLIFTTWH